MKGNGLSRSHKLESLGSHGRQTVGSMIAMTVHPRSGERGYERKTRPILLLRLAIA